MRYNPLPAQVYQRNRATLTKHLPERAVVILHANDTMPTNADGTMPFRQNNNLLYLTGIDQEETILVMAPDHPNPDLREVLFIRETSEEIAIWEGPKHTLEEGRERSGIEKVRWTKDFEGALAGIVNDSDEIFLYKNEHDRATNPVPTRNDRFIESIKRQFPLHKLNRLAPLLYDLRAVKTQEEIDAVQKACDITDHGFRALLSALRPGMYEYELEAILSYEFLRRGSRGFAYQPIVAGGANACILHYVENDQKLRDGDLVLLDVGAEYGNYNADLTRTIPVNGRFTKRQRDVYEAVLRVKNEATALLRPGANLKDYQEEVGKMMTSELIGLGLLTAEEVAAQDPKSPAYRKYFMHGTSHHLGLDVH
ncbi:MAG: aminopeptidase P family protein, partial [Bacteroidota bacterium]